jgi:uncharacterized protein YukJ
VGVVFALRTKKAPTNSLFHGHYKRTHIPADRFKKETNMPLNAYGVLRGKVIDGKREDDPNSPHYQLHLLSSGDHFRVAVNVKSQETPSELLFLVNETFQHPILPRLVDFQAGFTPLASNPDSCALDFIRGNLFAHEDMRLLPFNLPGQDNDLNDKIEYYANRARLDADAELFVFGTRWGPETIEDKVFHFKPGNGVHDIHMNQGNSASFMKDDGVWQDGALIFHFPATTQWTAVFLAFQSQAWHTDDQTGHAVAAPADPNAVLRIVGAMVNPFGPAPEKESVILLNTSPNDIDLQGWAITDKGKNRCNLSGKIAAGNALTVNLKLPVQLGNKGGLITLLNPDGLKVDGVAYTADQASREGWVIAF